jgi:DNA (cytosine-5)-methyltransferase 1
MVNGNHKITAIEFFSGIGGFAAVAPDFGIDVIQAFDQDESANRVYQANFQKVPDSHNLDSIDASQIARADMWWLSPPCTPYTSRGIRQGLGDRRSASMVNLLDQLRHLLPRTIVLENVLGFFDSHAYLFVRSILEENRYRIRPLVVCSSQFGVPMRRPRLFLTALRMAGKLDSSIEEGTLFRSQGSSCAKSHRGNGQVRVADFLSKETDDALLVSRQDLARYEAGMHIVDIEDAEAELICFTSGYGKYYKASGSFLRVKTNTVRRFSPDEILLLLGFDKHFLLPADISIQKRWKLVGNSLDLRCVRSVLSHINEIYDEAMPH